MTRPIQPARKEAHCRVRCDGRGQQLPRVIKAWESHVGLDSPSPCTSLQDALESQMQPHYTRFTPGRSAAGDLKLHSLKLTFGEKRHGKGRPIATKRLSRESTRRVLRLSGVSGMQGSRARQGQIRPAKKTHDGIAIGKIAEDGEVYGVNADEDDGETDDRTHPVGPTLRECENEGADGEEKTADEGRVEASFGPSSAHIRFVQVLLVEVAGKADRGGQTASDFSSSATCLRLDRRADAHESVECQADFALVEAVLRVGSQHEPPIDQCEGPPEPKCTYDILENERNRLYGRRNRQLADFDTETKNKDVPTRRKTLPYVKAAQAEKDATIASVPSRSASARSVSFHYAARQNGRSRCGLTERPSHADAHQDREA